MHLKAQHRCCRCTQTTHPTLPTNYLQEENTAAQERQAGRVGGVITWVINIITPCGTVYRLNIMFNIQALFGYKSIFIFGMLKRPVIVMNATIYMSNCATNHTFFRCIFDSLPDPAGAGRNAYLATGDCHWPASQERQRGSVEGHQPLSDWYWWVKQALEWFVQSRG